MLDTVLGIGHREVNKIKFLPWWNLHFGRRRRTVNKEKK